MGHLPLYFVNPRFLIKKPPLKITPWCDDLSSFVSYISLKQCQHSRLILLMQARPLFEAQAREDIFIKNS